MHALADSKLIFVCTSDYFERIKKKLWRLDQHVASTCIIEYNSLHIFNLWMRGSRRLSGRVTDSGLKGRLFETYLRPVVCFSKTYYRKYWLITQEAMAPSRHD